MATAWLTYAWEDNSNDDVDFAAQELGRVGVTVKLDRWNLHAGKRLWEQIADNITNPQLSDGWILFATQNSLGSEACKEEFAYALDRALHTRGETFPVIALFPCPVDETLISPAIRSRLFVSLTDPDWKERIKAGLENRNPNIGRPQVQPYFIQVHEQTFADQSKFVIEVRPRAGSWAPFFAAVLASERERVKIRILHGPKGVIPRGGMLVLTGAGLSTDNKYWIIYASNEATPTQSYYIFFAELPTELLFGVHNGSPQYRVPFRSS